MRKKAHLKDMSGVRGVVLLTLVPLLPSHPPAVPSFAAAVSACTLLRLPFLTRALLMRALCSMEPRQREHLFWTTKNYLEGIHGHCRPKYEVPVRTSDLERFRGLRSKFAMNGNVFVCALLSRECVLDSVGNKSRINFLHELQYTIIFYRILPISA